MGRDLYYQKKITLKLNQLVKVKTNCSKLKNLQKTVKETW